MPKNNTTPTYEQLINKAIRRLMLTITLLVSLITLLMVGTQQTINTTREARDLMSSLNQANIKDVPSFIQWNNTTTRNTKQPAFIRVTTKKATLTTASKTKRTIITTPSSKSFFTKQQTKLVGPLVYVRGFGFFLSYSEKDGHNLPTMGQLKAIVQQSAYFDSAHAGCHLCRPGIGDLVGPSFSTATE